MYHCIITLKYMHAFDLRPTWDSEHMHEHASNLLSFVSYAPTHSVQWHIPMRVYVYIYMYTIRTYTCMYDVI